MAGSEAPAAVEPQVGIKKDAVESAAIMRQESLQRHDSNAGASNVEPAANQTGTAKRKKKKKEEVFHVSMLTQENNVTLNKINAN